MLNDPALWLLGLYVAMGIMALRLVPGWLPLYAGELYREQRGFDRDLATLAGGWIGTLYVVGHVTGSPLVGRLSDWLRGHGVGGVMIAAGGLVLSMAGFLLLTVPIASPWLLGALAVLLGVSLHAFPLINALASERWGAPRAGESLGWINMVGQLAGAVSLSVSGYLGLNAASQSGGELTEYAGIWLFGAACCLLGACAGLGAHRHMREQRQEGSCR